MMYKINDKRMAQFLLVLALTPVLIVTTGFIVMVALLRDEWDEVTG